MQNKIRNLYLFFVLFFCTKITQSCEYKITELDKTNTEQVDKVRQFFAQQPLQSISSTAPEDRNQWIAENYVLLALNEHETICGVAIYYITTSKNIIVNMIAVTHDDQWHTVATELLEHLACMPNKISINTLTDSNDHPFYQFLQTFGCEQTDIFLKMQKQINHTQMTQHLQPGTIRPLDNTNKEEVAQFAALFEKELVGVSWTTEAMERFSTYDNYRFIAAFDEKNQLCAGVIYTFKATHWSIYVLATHKDHRRQGYATALIDYVKNAALKSNMFTLELYVLPTNDRAIACYQKYGFKQIETTYKLVKELPAREQI